MNKIEFDEFTERILSLSEKIRFVGVTQNDKMYYQMKSGIKSYLDKQVTEKSLKMQ